MDSKSEAIAKQKELAQASAESANEAATVAEEAVAVAKKAVKQAEADAARLADLERGPAKPKLIVFSAPSE